MNFHTEQKGYSLIELVVSLAILAIISVAIAMAISMINTHFHISKDQSIVWRQVQNAGFWVTRDLLTADDVVVDNDPVTPVFLTLTIPVVVSEDDEDPPNVVMSEKTVVYHLQDTAGGMKKLTRTDQDTGAQILIAEYIYYDPGEPDSTVVTIHDPPSLTIRFTSMYNNAVSSQEYEAVHRVPN